MRNPSRRRPLHAVVPSAVLLVSIGLLSGCMATPAPTDSSTPSAAAEPTATPPVFASDEEALAAAEAAYTAYEALSDSITADGGIRGDRIEPAASPKYLPNLLDSFVGFSKTGFISRGSSTFDNVSLIRNSVEPRGGVSIELYLCSDISEVRLIDKTGADVTPAGRTNRTPLQVGFTSSAANPSLLLLDKEDVWSGRNFC
ncbi:hypothetical protein E3T43_06710 [Cryobacterium sp. Hh7]|uniref:hypothetical protein n=1 Tax=Cryobacterium sp. Hh7 TaxID=1259159 RepID=UPI001069C569|nr:hypothetical protein [Cryobacterium sp. Hh7]TFD58627.1 hypothetical protein E3T43_06710 [Cryobacterium sp. Hh7]